MSKFIIEPHFRLHEWVAEEKGYFKAEGLDYEFLELVKSTAGQIHATPDKVGAFQSLEAGRKSDISCACHWTVAVAASKDHGKLYPGCYSVSPPGSSCRPIAREEPRGPRGRADLGRLPVRQPLLDHSGARAVHAARTHQAELRGWPAVRAHGQAARGPVAGLRAVLRPILLRRAARLAESDRHHLHDRDVRERQSRPRRREEVHEGADVLSATSIFVPTGTITTTRTSFPRSTTTAWTPAAGGRASASSSSPTARRRSTRPSVDRRAAHLRGWARLVQLRGVHRRRCGVGFARCDGTPFHLALEFPAPPNYVLPKQD